MIIPLRKSLVIIVVVIAIILVAVGIALYFILNTENTEIYRGAVVSNGLECAAIGRNMLLRKGTVADAAIATLFCEGIANPQSMGLGGGFLATIYIKSKGLMETFVAREMAPLAATETMFVNQSIQGGLAVGVPGEILGYSELHRAHGKLKWSELIEPTINLCLEGIPVSPYLATKLKEKENEILNSPSIRELYIDPNTKKVYGAGQKIKYLKLAETLKTIASEGPDAIYNGGSIGKKLVEDIRGYGGIITEEDLKQYRVRRVAPVTTLFKDNTIISMPLPGTGPVLNVMLNMIQNHVTDDRNLFWHRVMECFKHGYGLRTHLGDLDFLPQVLDLAESMSKQDFADELYKLVRDNRTFYDYGYYGANYTSMEDHGTANIGILTPEGDAISVTSTINMILGAMIVSTQTGIILNNEMDDFSTPNKVNGFGLAPSPANFIRPKKMPLSSMVPTIILDKDKNARMVVGAAGGSKITTSVAQTIIRHLLLGESLNYAVQTPRLHHQLSPMEVQHEKGYDPKIIAYLRKLGHETREISPENGFSAVTAISTFGKQIEASYDSRRPGSVAYL